MPVTVPPRRHLIEANGGSSIRGYPARPRPAARRRSANVGQASTARLACSSSPWADRPFGDQRVAPVIEGDRLREQLRAQSVRLAGDRVDLERDLLLLMRPPASGPGDRGPASGRAGPDRSCTAAPAGGRGNPTRRQRSRSRPAAPCRRDGGRRRGRTPASTSDSPSSGRPGHWRRPRFAKGRRLSRRGRSSRDRTGRRTRRQDTRTIRAVSETPQAPSRRPMMTPGPRLPPALRRAATPRRMPSASAALNQVPPYPPTRIACGVSFQPPAAWASLPRVMPPATS